MKKFIFILAVALGFTMTANAQKIQFNNLDEGNYLNYGEIEQNADGLRVINFTNTGDKPLILSNVKTSCGCTVPSWEKEPIMPGKSAEIKVKYATNRLGPINKVITVTSNDVDNPSTMVRLKGKVNGEPATQPAVATKH